MKRRLAVMVALFAGSVGVQAQTPCIQNGDVEAGHQLFDRFCADCHPVKATMPVLSEPNAADLLERFLPNHHGTWGPEERAALIAYLQSLQ